MTKQFTSAVVLKLAELNKLLYAQIKNEPKFEIVPDKPSSFFAKDEDIRIKFTTNSNNTYKLVFYKGLNSKIGDRIDN